MSKSYQSPCWFILAVFLLAFVIDAPGAQTEPNAGAASPSNLAVIPLTRAHAHNDYEHARPLLDALDNGFCSFEADVYLIDGKLLVAHDRNKTSPKRTLQALYLNPLRERVRRYDGRVYPGGPPCWLFVDLKTEAESTYAALDALLAGYSEMVSRFEGGRMTTNAITVVVTGNRPRATIAGQTVRNAAYDGLFSDLDTPVPNLLVPIISEQWTKHFKWRGKGPVSAEDLSRLKEVLDKAHGQKRLMRFWAAPDQADAWSMLMDAGVDLINTDNLPGLRAFLLENRGETAAGWRKYR